MEKSQEVARNTGTETTEGSSHLEQMLGVVGKLSKNNSAVETELKDAVQILFEHVLKDYDRSSKELPQLHHKIEAMIAEIDSKLSLQVNEIIHHPDFQKLEGSWRGLRHMIDNTVSSNQLKVKVLNITEKELHKSCSKNGKGQMFERTPLFKKIYEEEFGVPGGSPFASIIGDFQFGTKGRDIETIRVMSKIAAAAHAPFIASASPESLGIEDWTDITKISALGKKQEGAEFAAWNSLRDAEESRYIGLTMPRFLAREPYSTKNNPIEGFAFEEQVDGSDHSKYCWSNASYAMGANINRAFDESGWATTIRGLESGGIVEGLPVHAFPTSDGGVDVKCPTEVALNDRHEKELADLGLMPLSFYKNSDYACFFSAQSLKKPTKYADEDATANEALSCRLPYMFATCRFAHYLKCMVRDKIGQFMERDEMEQWLSDWIMGYVLKSGGDDVLKAKRPLADARVEVVDVEGDPGNYRATFYLRPHFQLEGLTASLRLVSKLPQNKA